MSLVICPVLPWLRYGRAFLFNAYNEDPTWGACVSKMPGVRNATGTGRRKAVLGLFPLFYGTKVSCIGYLDHGVAV